MMKDETDSVCVKIWGRVYKLRCPPEKKDLLVAAARYLDGQIQKVHAQGQIVGSDRILIMTALNIAHELLQLQAEHRMLQDQFSARTHDLNRLIEDVLNDESQ